MKQNTRLMLNRCLNHTLTLLRMLLWVALAAGAVLLELGLAPEVNWTQEHSASGRELGCLGLMVIVLYLLVILIRHVTEQISDWPELLHTIHLYDGCLCVECGHCRPLGHDWNGCTCRRCGAKRNEEHDWEGCTCRRCGAERDEEHDWNGCVCRRCKRDRHLWQLYASETEWVLPEGVSGCLENMCFLEEVTVEEYRCTRCGSSDFKRLPFGNQA